MKLLIATALLTSAVNAFANVSSPQCDDKNVRSQAANLLQQNVSSFGSVDTSSIKVTNMIPENVVMPGASPLAAYFQVKDKGSVSGTVSSWIAQFGLNYGGCQVVYLGAARAN